MFNHWEVEGKGWREVTRVLVGSGGVFDVDYGRNIETPFQCSLTD
jgi:hypothetical protein